MWIYFKTHNKWLYAYVFAVSYRMVRKINSVYALLKVRDTYSKWNQKSVEDGGRRKFTQILKVEPMKKFRSKERNKVIKGEKARESYEKIEEGFPLLIRIG